MLCLVKNYAGIEDLQCLTILLEQANCVWEYSQNGSKKKDGVHVKKIEESQAVTEHMLRQSNQIYGAKKRQQIK